MILSFDVWHGNTGFGFSIIVLEFWDWLHIYLGLEFQLKIRNHGMKEAFEKHWEREVELT